MEKERNERDPEEMREEYDFSGGVRGKHYKAYRSGHRVHIRNSNGSISDLHFTPEEGAVMLDPDLKRDFPDSESVNKALRLRLKGPASDSRFIARLPWRQEQPVNDIHYPPGYQPPEGCPLPTIHA